MRLGDTAQLLLPSANSASPPVAEANRAAARSRSFATASLRAVGGLRRRNLREVDSRRVLAVGLDRFLDRQVLREERVGGGLADERLDLGAAELAVAVRERQPHAREEVRAVLRLPAHRLRVEQAIFERQVGRGHLVDVRVHALRVRADAAGTRRVRVGQAIRALGTPREPHRARLAVERHGAVADEFAQRARDGAGLDFHLEETVARVDPADRAIGVLDVRREDVRDAAVVEAHVDGAAQARDHGRFRGREVGARRDGPDTVRWIEEGTERRSAPHGNEPHVERRAQDEGGESGGNRRGSCGHGCGIRGKELVRLEGRGRAAQLPATPGASVPCFRPFHSRT